MSFLSMRRAWYVRLISLCLLVTFTGTMTITPRAFAQEGILGLPQPGTMVNLSPAYVPFMLTGLTIHPENPLLMDFIVSTGNSGMDAQQVKKESGRLIKYFLACLTIPENNQWVNLSPYEKQRIIPEDLGQTVLGQDMLAQDYLLKQLTASLIYPEKNLGRDFWNTVYSQARQMYGTSQIPVNTFNKVWILPQYAKVYTHNNTVFVVKSHLRVMLDEDYLALSHHVIPAKAGIHNKNNINTLGSQIVRQIILPAIEREVNTGENFAQMRQIYNSMILAVWFKSNLKQALLTQVYADKSKINGVNVDDPAIKEKIYRQYLQAYKKGVFNYIKEETDQAAQQPIPRKYFSGGLTPETASTVQVEGGLQGAEDAQQAVIDDGKEFEVKGVDVPIREYLLKRPYRRQPSSTNAAMVAQTVKILFADAPGEGTVEAVNKQLQGIVSSLPKGTKIEIVSEIGIGKDPVKLQQVIEREKPAIVLVRSDTKAFSKPGFLNMARANGVHALVRMGAGYENIDDAYAAQKGIAVIRTHGSAESVADLTLYLTSLLGAMGFQKNGSAPIPLGKWSDISNANPDEYAALIRKGKWSSDLPAADKERMIDKMSGRIILQGRPYRQLVQALDGQVFGLMGFGPIPQLEAQKLQEIREQTGARFEVIAATRSFNDPNSPQFKLAKQLGVYPVSREDLFKQATIISIHVPDKTDIPRISFEELEHPQIKAVINTSREALIPEETMEAFVDKGGFFLGDLDITPYLFELMSNQRVFIFPHIGAGTKEAKAGVEENTIPVVEEIVRRLVGQNPPTSVLDIVNGTPVKPSVSAAMTAEEEKKLNAWLTQAERAAFMEGQERFTVTLRENGNNISDWSFPVNTSINEALRGIVQDTTKLNKTGTAYRYSFAPMLVDPNNREYSWKDLVIFRGPIKSPVWPSPVLRPANPAMTNGGIDLNSRNLNMESSGEKVNIAFDPAMIAQFKRGDFSGVRIKILDVVPVDLLPLLGLKEERAEQLAKV